MAWVFGLSAECGPDERKAERLAQYFKTRACVLANGDRCQCRADTFQDIEENWWCRVCPDKIGEVGIDAPDSAYWMTELGIWFYQQLCSAPAFRYALVGVEVDEFRTYRELLEDAASLPIAGLVLSVELSQVLGLGTDLHSFSAGYVWYPYEGEVYNPLMTSPVLKHKLNALLAVTS